MKIYDFPQGSEQWERIRMSRPTASNFDKFISNPKLVEYVGLAMPISSDHLFAIRNAKKQQDVLQLIRDADSAGVEILKSDLDAAALSALSKRFPGLISRRQEMGGGTLKKGDATMRFIDNLLAQAVLPYEVIKSEQPLGSRATDTGTEREPEARQAFADLTGYEVEQVGFVIRDKCKFAGCSPDGLILNRSEGVELKAPNSDTHVGYVREGILPDDYVLQVHGSMAVTGLKAWHFFSYYPGLKPLHLRITWNSFTDSVCTALDDFAILYTQTRNEVLQKLK